MLTLTGDSINSLFAQACAAVLGRGQVVSPRGLRTREVLGAWLCLTSPRHRVLHVPPRVINPAFAAAEAVWILSGSDGEWIYGFNRKLTAYTDDGLLQGAYGPRLRRWPGRSGSRADRPGHLEEIDQLERVTALLRRDPDTRQALVQLFDAARDHRGHRDVPCTLSWRFYLRQGRLHLHTTMRSQDLWLGLPYDVFTFTVLQELVAGWLDVGVGEYHHHVDSLHLYEPHWEPARQTVLTGASPPSGPQMAPLRLPWPDLDPLLADLVSGVPELPRRVERQRQLPGGWAQIATVMTSYRMWKRGDRGAARALTNSVPGALTDTLQHWYEHLEPSTQQPLASSRGTSTAPTRPADVTSHGTVA